MDIINTIGVIIVLKKTVYKENIRKDAKYDVIVVGGGLAGLSCAFYACKRGKKVLLLEKRKFLGGRTSSFNDMGMEVESGLHRYIGYYNELPRLLKHCGIKIKDIVTWEEKIDIILNKHYAHDISNTSSNKITLGVSPFYGPIKMIKSLLYNNEFLNKEDKFTLFKFFIYGIKDYLLNENLDDFSVQEYAELHNVTKNAQNVILEPLSSGLFFLPLSNYSAFAFFKMLMPAIPRFYKMRVGAFLGGMTEIMCDPIGDAIVSMGGNILCNEDVDNVIVNNNQVIGVKTKDNHAFYASHTVIATPLNVAKSILNDLQSYEELNNFFELPTMSVCTIQIELLEPALEKDITTFAPMTNLVSFAEQSRSTFKNKQGRLSIILGKYEELSKYSTDELLKIVVNELSSLGININSKIIKCRKISECEEFYSLNPGSESLRPKQYTGIKGLILAGDYTKTSSLCTMEGAVISGKKAAKLCTKK